MYSLLHRDLYTSLMMWPFTMYSQTIHQLLNPTLLKTALLHLLYLLHHLHQALQALLHHPHLHLIL
jgi:hypothetical protein